MNKTSLRWSVQSSADFRPSGFAVFSHARSGGSQQPLAEQESASRVRLSLRRSDEVAATQKKSGGLIRRSLSFDACAVTELP